MSGFTRGPWFVQKNEYGDLVVNSENIGVCNVGREPQNGEPAIANFGHERGPVVEADARLISAAPELYEALRLCGRDYAIAEMLSEQTIAKAKAALAKARGETL
jgi:hypothetical protein